jgi:hypothetical protein
MYCVLRCPPSRRPLPSPWLAGLTLSAALISSEIEIGGQKIDKHYGE